MKARDIFRLSYREMKLGKATLILGFLMILFFFFVAFSIFYFSYSFLDNFYQYLRDAAPESAMVEYSTSDPLNELEMLKNFGYESNEIEMISGMNHHLHLEKADATKIEINYSMVNVMTFHESGPPTITGRTYTPDDNTATIKGIWLEKTVADKYNLSVGDKIILKNGNDSLTALNLMGIFSSGDIPYGGLAVVPLVAMTEICNGTGLYMPAIIDLQVKEPSTYFMLKSYLAEKKIDLVSRFEIVYTVIDLISDLFRIFAYFTLLLAVISFMNYCRIFIHSRINNILMYKTLGMSDRIIILIYYTMTLALLTVSYFLSFLLHLASKTYFKDVYSKVLGVNVMESGNSILFALFGFVFCIIALTIVFLLNSKQLFFAADVQRLQVEREVI